MDPQKDPARRSIEAADALLLATGAGMGVDSGLPDFRGNTGFWRAYPALEKAQKTFTEIANPAAFEQTPRVAWAFYGHRLELYRRTRPHDGFARLLAFGSGLKEGMFVFTSNVDGHFQAAGFHPDRIVECHGSIHHLQCTRPCCGILWSANGTEVAIHEPTFEADGVLPACPRCGALARPNVLLFGDGGWITSRTRSQEKRLQRWLERIALNRAKLAVLEIGAGLAVPTVRITSERLSRAFGATLVRINPREPGTPNGGYGFAVGALEGIRMLVPERRP
jgi:NAD-dependent SIR2 family protein deacetylase